MHDASAHTGPRRQPVEPGGPRASGFDSGQRRQDEGTRQAERRALLRRVFSLVSGEKSA